MGLPLRQAVRGGHLAVVEAILAAGAIPNVVDRTGWTALTAADELGYVEIADRPTAAGADPSLRRIHGTSRLHRSARDDSGWTPDFETVRQLNQDFESFRLLVEAGADLSLSDHQDHAIMVEIAAHGDDRFVGLAHGAGAALEPRWLWGWTPVHVAATTLNVSALIALLTVGDSRDATDDVGRTPRMLVEADRDANESELVPHVLAILDG